MDWKVLLVTFVGFVNSLLAITCSQPIVVSDLREDGKLPSVAINTRGDVAVAWIGIQNFQESIRVSCKDVQGEWSYPKIILEEIEGNRPPMNPPRCFLGDQGDTYVLWKSWLSDDAEYVQKICGDDWAKPISLSLNINRYCNFVFDRSGNFLFLSDKVEQSLFSGKIITAQVHVKKPTQLETEVLTPPGAKNDWFSNQKYARGEVIGLNSIGDIFVVWRKDLNFANSAYQGSWLLPDRSFTQTEELSADIKFLDCFLSGIAIDVHKNVAIVGVKENKIQVLNRINDQWSEWVALSEEDKKKGSWFMPRPQVAVDNQGNLLVVWKMEAEAGTSIKSAYKGFQQDWIFLEKIVIEGKVDKILLRSDGKENFIVLWGEKKDRSSSGIYAVEFSDKERIWSPISLLSPQMDFCSEPSLEFSKNGQGILSWTKSSSSFDSCIEVVELSLGQETGDGL